MPSLWSLRSTHECKVSLSGCQKEYRACVWCWMRTLSTPLQWTTLDTEGSLLLLLSCVYKLLQNFCWPIASESTEKLCGSSGSVWGGDGFQRLSDSTTTDLKLTQPKRFNKKREGEFFSFIPLPWWSQAPLQLFLLTPVHCRKCRSLLQGRIPTSSAALLLSPSFFSSLHTFILLLFVGFFMLKRDSFAWKHYLFLAPVPQNAYLPHSVKQPGKAGPAHQALVFCPAVIQAWLTLGGSVAWEAGGTGDRNCLRFWVTGGLCHLSFISASATGQHQREIPSCSSFSSGVFFLIWRQEGEAPKNPHRGSQVSLH